MKLLIFNLLILIPIVLSAKLSISGKHFAYNGQQVFLSGANFAWNDYSKDFGSGAYTHSKAKLEGWLAKIEAAGGNAVRIWLHSVAIWSPKFDSHGFATGADTESLIKELGEFLDAAEKHNIFIIICLWNGARPATPMMQLYHNEEALQSYLDKVLTPMVKALAGHKALAAWEVGNELEGLLKHSITDSNPCFDTHKISASGAGWAVQEVTMKELLRFINRHAAAIHSAAPGSLVTFGDFQEVSNTDAFSHAFNHYKDECLTAAGGKTNGHLDFYQMHTYSKYTATGHYVPISCMLKNAADYKLDKPVLIGEFSTHCSDSGNATHNYEHAYNGGYAGVLAWQYNESDSQDCKDCCGDKQSVIDEGMNSIRNMTSNGKIRINM